MNPEPEFSTRITWGPGGIADNNRELPGSRLTGSEASLPQRHTPYIFEIEAIHRGHGSGGRSNCHLQVHLIEIEGVIKGSIDPSTEFELVESTH